MPLGNNDFFSLENLLGVENSNFFTNTDTKSILGKNIVLNFLGKIEFEIRNLGYSDTANDIAEFYEKCKKDTCGIIGFFTNPVIQMILNEIQNMPTIRAYLKNRILDEIELDKIKNLNDTFENNEDILEKQKEERTKFLKEKELYKKRINRIMNKYKCTFEQAEQIYKEQEEQAKIKELNENLDKTINSMFGISTEVHTKSHKPNKNKATEIILDDEIIDDTQFSDDNNFWSL